MAEAQGYRCPCCGAPLLFSAEQQDLHCNSCGNDFTMDTLTQLAEAGELENRPSQYNWDEYEPRDYSSDEVLNLSGYSCPSCGAEITGDQNLGATMCPYCGNSTIIPSQFQNNLRPDYLIPFRQDKKAAMERFEAACKEAPFLPNEFKNERKIAEMTGIYVPFWMFDCDCHADISYRAQHVTMWSDTRYDYVKTDFFKLLRSGKIRFANVPVDGSKKAGDAFMEAIEPYDYNDAVDFNTAYLSGFLADKYDVSVEESQERANARVKKSTEQAFQSTTSHFSSVQPENSNIQFSGGKTRYALLPVWMLNIQYRGTTYPFAINGQTGKVVGEFPVSKKKQWLYFAKVYGISLLVAGLLTWIYLKWL